MRSSYVLLGAALALVAFSVSSGANHGNQQPDAVVFIHDFMYDSDGDLPLLQAAPGNLVLFVNTDNLVHTVDSVGPFEVHSGPLEAGDHFAFNAPGTGIYEIHCTTNELHTALMHMLLVVS